MAEERLQKFMARAGVASRRACEKLIADGEVLVNGKVVRELGVKITPGVDRVEYGGHQIVADERLVYLLLHKPQQVISAAVDPQGREVATDLIPPDFGRVYPVGRLDWDSEGALLMTNDGQLTQLLTHPRHEVVKTYMVKLKGLIGDEDDRVERVRHGVVLDDRSRTLPCEVVRDSVTGRHTWFVVSIREGRNRQIRRMFEAVGIDVLRLRRIAYGPVVLGDLPPCDFRRLTESEIDELYAAAGEKRPKLSASRGRLAHGTRDGKIAVRKKAQRTTRPIARRGDNAPPEDEAPPSSGPGRRPRPGRDGAPDREERAPRDERGQRGAPTERGQRGAPAERGQRGAPTERGQRGAPAEKSPARRGPGEKSAPRSGAAERPSARRPSGEKPAQRKPGRDEGPQQRRTGRDGKPAQRKPPGGSGRGRR